MKTTNFCSSEIKWFYSIALNTVEKIEFTLNMDNRAISVI